jgi:hypothetical protein
VIKLVLLDSEDKLVSTFTTNWNVNKIKGGTADDFKANVDFEDTPAGTYKLSIGFYRNEKDQMPTYNLDEKGRTEDGFYVIGDLKIEP